MFYFVSMYPLCLVPSVGTTEKNLAPFSSFPLTRYLYKLINPTKPSFLKAKQPQLSSLLYDQCPSPLVIFVILCWICFFMSLSFSYFSSPLISQFNSCSKTLLPGSPEESFQERLVSNSRQQTQRKTLSQENCLNSHGQQFAGVLRLVIKFPEPQRDTQRRQSRCRDC